ASSSSERDTAVVVVIIVGAGTCVGDGGLGINAIGVAGAGVNIAALGAHAATIASKDACPPSTRTSRRDNLTRLIFIRSLHIPTFRGFRSAVLWRTFPAFRVPSLRTICPLLSAIRHL